MSYEPKDMMGNAIEVGDTIAYVSDRGGPFLTMGKVIKLDGYKQMIQIARAHSSGRPGSYNKISNGNRKKWVWDSVNETGYYADTPAAPVYVRMTDRCLLVKKIPS